jgi:hypothetical protein
MLLLLILLLLLLILLLLLLLPPGCNIKWTPGSEPAYYGEQIVQK